MLQWLGYKSVTSEKSNRNNFSTQPCENRKLFNLVSGCNIQSFIYCEKISVFEGVALEMDNEGYRIIGVEFASLIAWVERSFSQSTTKQFLGVV
jgi:hypothetical protein